MNSQANNIISEVRTAREKTLGECHGNFAELTAHGQGKAREYEKIGWQIADRPITQWTKAADYLLPDGETSILREEPDNQ